jgi:predicted dehydrogenase
MVCVAAPNALHRDITVAAAQAGKHVICEKPLARTLHEADEMISACAAAGVLLMYAEEICFAPKYVRAKELADEGALGDVYLVRQT